MQDANIIKTKKLYYDDAYATDFTAVILAAKDGDVVLDQTLFFPEEGGQSPDTGTLGGRPVVDVQIRDGEIHHILGPDASAGHDALVPGCAISGRIDWKRRFSNMQQHSGEHIISGLIHSRFGYDNIGFHLSDREVTLDFGGPLTQDELDEIELAANRVVTSNIETEIRFVPGNDASLPYRSKLDLSGEVRLVVYPGVDVCACCAPHVARTGEIGLIKIVGVTNLRGGVRVSILCGERALALLQKEHRIVSETAGFLTTSADEVLPMTQKMREELRDLRAKNRALEIEALDAKILALPPDTEHAVLFVPELDTAAARAGVGRMSQFHPGYSAIFIGNGGGAPYSFVIGSQNLDARDAVALLRERFGARGGGKPDMAQGSVQAESEELRQFFNTAPV